MLPWLMVRWSLLSGRTSRDTSTSTGLHVQKSNLGHYRLYSELVRVFVNRWFCAIEQCWATELQIMEIEFETFCNLKCDFGKCWKKISWKAHYLYRPSNPSVCLVLKLERIVPVHFDSITLVLIWTTYPPPHTRHPIPSIALSLYIPTCFLII